MRFNARLTETESGFNARLAETESRLDQRISETAAQVNERLTQTEARVNERLEKSEQRIKGEIKADVREQVAAAERRLEEHVGRRIVESEVRVKDALHGEMTRGFDRVDLRFQQMNEQLQTQTRWVAASIVAALAVLPALLKLVDWLTR